MEIGLCDWMQSYKKQSLSDIIRNVQKKVF